MPRYNRKAVTRSVLVSEEAQPRERGEAEGSDQGE